jgi:hypothetical protein
VLLLEEAEHADVRRATGTTARQHESYARTWRVFEVRLLGRDDQHGAERESRYFHGLLG